MSGICFEIDPSHRLLRGGQACVEQVGFLSADLDSLSLTLRAATGVELALLPLASRIP